MTTRTALLLPGPIAAIGGAPMRWRALRDALTPLGCAVHEISCDRRAECLRVCGSTGTSRVDSQFIWYHNRKFCTAYADSLLARFTAEGVSTIICSGLETFEYVNYFASLGTVRVVYDMHNVEHLLYRAIRRATPDGSLQARLFTDEHIAMVAAAEASAIASANRVWCCTPKDRRTVLSTFPLADPGKVRVVPNVVATPAIPPKPGAAPRHACFVGRFDHYPNIVAARMLLNDVAPLLAAAGSPFPLVIAGANMGSDLCSHTSMANVELIADPPDVGPLIRNGIMLVPLTIGGGSRLKVLEAFAAGAAVVSTAIGVEGLGLTPDVHYKLAETAAEFAAATLTLVHDHRQRSRLVAEAWPLVSGRYSVRALAERFATAGGDLW
jgi:glycosyltransferase involved in cell wall biosynthesis